MEQQKKNLLTFTSQDTGDDKVVLELECNITMEEEYTNFAFASLLSKLMCDKKHIAMDILGAIGMYIHKVGMSEKDIDTLVLFLKTENPYSEPSPQKDYINALIRNKKKNNGNAPS